MREVTTEHPDLKENITLRKVKIQLVLMDKLEVKQDDKDQFVADNAGVISDIISDNIVLSNQEILNILFDKFDRKDLVNNIDIDKEYARIVKEKTEKKS